MQDDNIIRTGDFDVGYVQNNSVVTLRSHEDIRVHEIWSTLSKGTKVILWCDGLREISRRAAQAGNRNIREVTILKMIQVLKVLVCLRRVSMKKI